MCKSLLLSLLLILCLFPESFGKETVSGHIRDAATGEVLVGANIIVEELGTGTSTNEYGYYALTLDADSYTLLYSFVGYATVTRQIRLTESMILNVELSEQLTVA